MSQRSATLKRLLVPALSLLLVFAGARAAGTPVEAAPAMFQATQLVITAANVNGGVSPIAGTAFTVTVTATGSNSGKASVAYNVTLTRTGGGTGVLGGTVTLTMAVGANSLSFPNLTYTKAETLTLTATRTSGGDNPAAGTSPAFTVRPGVATKLAVFSVNGGSNVVAGTGFPVVVQSQDANGNLSAVAATTGITLSRGAGTGTLGGTLTGSIALGTNTATISGVTYTKAETGVTIVATRTSGDVLSAGTSAGFTVVAGVVTQVDILASGVNGGVNPKAGTAFQVVVSATDANGNPQIVGSNTGVQISLASGNGTLTLGGGSTATILSGASTATISGVSYNLAQSNVIIAVVRTSGDALTDGASPSITVDPGLATKLVISSVNGGSNPQAGTAFTVVVQAQDALNNPAPVAANTGITLSKAAGTGTLGGTLTGTITAGTNSVSLSTITYTKAESGVQVQAARTSGDALSTGTSAAFTVSAGAASKLVFSTQPSAATAGIAISPAVVVQVQDANNNIVTSDTRSIVMTIGTNPSGATLGGTTTVSAVAGVATFSTLSVNKAPFTYTLVATATFAVTSNSFNISVGPLAQLGITSVNGGSNPVAGTAFSVIVQSQDAGGNPVVVTQATGVSLSRAVGTGTLGGTLTGTIPGGGNNSVTISGVTYTKAESGVQILASRTSGDPLSAGTSAGFTVNPGVATTFAITTVNGGSSPVAGTPFSVVVQSQDANGNASAVVANTSFSLFRSPGAGTGSLGGTTTGTILATTNSITVSGLTYIKAEIGVRLTATRTGGDALTDGQSAAFTVVPGAVASLSFTAQPLTTQSVSQINNSGGNSGGVKVTLFDANGNIATNATPNVTMTIGNNAGAGGSGVLSGTTTVVAGAVTAGVAVFPDLTIDKIGTGYTLTATATVAATSSAFNILLGPVAQLGITTINGGVPPTAGVPFAVVVQSQDAGGNPQSVGVSPKNVSLRVGVGTSILGGNTAGSIAANGNSTTVSGITYTKAEGIALIASTVPPPPDVTSLADGASVTFNVNPAAASKLAITSVNAGISPAAGITFPVVVQSQDQFGNPSNVTSATSVALTRAAGTGTMGGTTTGTIAINTNTQTISGVTYSTAESGVTLTATQTSGTVVLTAGTSAAFTVVPAKLVITSINGGTIHPIVGTPFPVVVQSQDALGNPANVTSATVVTLTVGAGTGSLGGTVAGTIANGGNTVTITVTYSKGESGVRLTATQTSGTPVLPPDTTGAFTVNGFAVAGTELIQNRDFSNGTTSWQLFEEPDIVSSVASGVFQFFKASPTTTASGVASVFQETNAALADKSPIVAEFALGNSTTVRKRISVVIADGDLSDVAACTFELPAGATLKTYKMFTHTTKLWANASLRFYAEDGGADGGNYLLDNVSMKYVPTQSALWTACVDPTAPAASGTPDSTANLVTNGDFATGLASWNTTGTVTTQLTSAVLEFIRPTATTPAPVLLQGADFVSQSTGQALVANQVLTATLQLGNSSAVRKRVTVRLGDADLSDQTACTFWVPPATGLLTYTMRGFASLAWANATISVYPETAGSESWIQLDNVTLRRTGNYPVAGAECMEPVPGVAGGIAVLGGSDAGAAATGGSPIDTLDSHAPGWMGTGGFSLTSDASSSAGTGTGWRAEAWTTGRATLVWAEPLDLTSATAARLSFESWLSARATSSSSGEVQVSLDGVTWQTVATVPGTDAWTEVDVDLDAFVGRMVYVRFVFDAVAPSDGGPPDVWRIDGVAVAIGG